MNFKRMVSAMLAAVIGVSMMPMCSLSTFAEADEQYEVLPFGMENEENGLYCYEGDHFVYMAEEFSENGVEMACLDFSAMIGALEKGYVISRIEAEIGSVYNQQTQEYVADWHGHLHPNKGVLADDTDKMILSNVDTNIVQFFADPDDWYVTVKDITVYYTIDTSIVAADYSDVDAAIAEIPRDLSVYTEDSVDALNAAVDAVDRTLTADQQDDVDAMAQAIRDAIAALELVELSEVLPFSIANDGGGFYYYESDNFQFMGEDFSENGIELACLNFSAMLGARKKGITITRIEAEIGSVYDQQTRAYVTDWHGHLYPGAGMIAENTDQLVLSDINADLVQFFADPDNWYVTVKDITVYFTMESSSETADYTDVDAALSKVPSDLSVYTKDSTANLDTAVKAVRRNLKIERQDEVTEMAQAIYDAIDDLEPYELQYESYLVAAPTVLRSGLYNQRSYYIDETGTRVDVSDKVWEKDASLSFAQWYLRTMIQFKDNGDGTLELRFVSMLDENINAYKEAGFMLTVNGINAEPISTTVVNDSFVVEGETVSISDYSEANDFFFIQTYLVDAALVEANPSFDICPYVTRMDGTILTGKPDSFRLTDFTK